jgi:hypothetical protein
VDDRIPAGTYTGMGLTISDAIMRFNDGTPEFDLVTGPPVDATIETPFVVTDGGSVTITLDFDAETSITAVGLEWQLDPRITVDEIVVTT